jgi:hypothetical protein
MKGLYPISGRSNRIRNFSIGSSCRGVPSYTSVTEVVEMGAFDHGPLSCLLTGLSERAAEGCAEGLAGAAEGSEEAVEGAAIGEGGAEGAEVGERQDSGDEDGLGSSGGRDEGDPGASTEESGEEGMGEEEEATSLQASCLQGRLGRWAEEEHRWCQLYKCFHSVYASSDRSCLRVRKMRLRAPLPSLAYESKSHSSRKGSFRRSGGRLMSTTPSFVVLFTIVGSLPGSTPGQE